MSETYAAGGQEDTATGRFILLVTSSVAAVLVLAGLIYALGTGQRHEAALAAAGCVPSLSPSGLPCTTWQALDSSYTAILAPASQQLSVDAAAYAASEGDNLAAAKAALTAEVATERAFDTSLTGIAFPPAIAPLATTLVQADAARATLTAEQSLSSSLSQMRSFNARVEAASAVVQTEMKRIRTALESPPAPG